MSAISGITLGGSLQALGRSNFVRKFGNTEVDRQFARKNTIEDAVALEVALAAAKAKAAELKRRTTSSRGRRIERTLRRREIVHATNAARGPKRPFTGGIAAARSRKLQFDREAKERRRITKARREAERNRGQIDRQIKAALGSLLGGF